MYLLSESDQSTVVSQGAGSCCEETFLDQYEVLRTIGHGEFSQVLLARHHLTGAQVAVKVLKMVVQNIPVLSEHRILKRLEHPNIVQLFQVMPTLENLYIMMEHAAGEELRKCIPQGGMKRGEALRIFKEIVCTVAYCHEKGVVHRDLKPENIMVDSAGHIKLIDFGLSARFSAGQMLNNFWGTLAYLAPEIVLRKEYEGPPADVWSLGVMLYFMLTGSRPFRGGNAQQMLMNIVLARYYIPGSVPTKARGLIRWILSPKPKQRPTLKQILQHPWLRLGEPCVPYPSRQALPSRPDPAILTMLFDMGFDPYQTWLSVAKKKFDAAMASYLLLKHQQGQGLRSTFQGQPVPPWLRPGPRPEDLSPEPVLPRSTSEPALNCSFPSSWEYSLPKKAQKPGHKATQGASLPAIPIHCPPPGAPTISISSQSDSDFPLPDTSTVFMRWSGSDSTTCSSWDTATAPHSGRTTGWKRVRRRIAACVRRLCCCLPWDSTKVAPVPQRRKVPQP